MADKRRFAESSSDESETSYEPAAQRRRSDSPSPSEAETEINESGWRILESFCFEDLAGHSEDQLEELAAEAARNLEAALHEQELIDAMEEDIQQGLNVIEEIPLLEFPQIHDRHLQELIGILGELEDVLRDSGVESGSEESARSSTTDEGYGGSHHEEK